MTWQAILGLRRALKLFDLWLFSIFFRNLRSAHIVELIGAVPNGFPYYILLGESQFSLTDLHCVGAARLIQTRLDVP